MKILVIDTENTGALRNAAHPFDPNNRLAYIGAYDGKDYHTFNIQHNKYNMYGDAIRKCQNLINKADVLVGFNIKYDLHWLRNYGITFSNKRIWDCQLAEFILNRQTIPYPSLDDSARRNLDICKSDILKNYLDQGIDVDSINEQELLSYLIQDLHVTHLLYLHQKKIIKPYWELFNIQCQDLLILQDMEYNGLRYDLETSKKKVDEYLVKEKEIKACLSLLVPEKFVNWNSAYHLSAILYGGAVSYDERTIIGTYKSGNRRGTARYSVKECVHMFPKLVEPRPMTALSRQGAWSTAEPVLRELKATGKGKAIIDLVLELSATDKLRSTYFQGIPNQFSVFGWENGIMHGSLNQCVARTGRISSSRPNLQNVPEGAKEMFVSRFD